MFKEKYIVNSNDIDSTLQIRLSSLLRYMQDTATNHADKIKIGHKDLEKDRNIWVIIRMFLEVNRLPKLDEEFIVTTHPGKNKSFLFPRYFQVYDKHNNLLLNASSTWVVINYNTRKVVINPFKDRKLPEEEDKYDLPLPEKVTGESPTLIETRRAKDSKFHREKMVSSMLINFDKEIMEGDNIELYSNSAEPEIIHGKVNEQNSFSAKVTYKQR